MVSMESDAEKWGEKSRENKQVYPKSQPNGKKPFNWLTQGTFSRLRFTKRG